jgi:type VII secretion integral membrane protein EccD
VTARQVAAGPQAVRVTVVGATRRADLTVPPATVAELLPDLVALVEGTADEDEPQGWTLTRLDGVPLALERSLAAAGVLDGELLYLRRAADAGEPAVVEDFAEAVATAVEASGGRWRARHLGALLIGLGALGLVMGAATVAPASFGEGLGAAGLPVAAAVSLSGVAAGLARLLRRPPAGAALALAALPWYAAGGEHLVAGAGAGGGPVLLAAGALAGLLVGAVAAWAAAPVVLGPAAAVAVTAAPLAAGAFAAGAGRATPEQAAVVLAVVLSLVPAALPGAAARAAGLLAGGDGDVPARTAQPGVRQARRLLGWLLAGAGVALAVPLAVLAFTPDTIGRLLCAAAILTAALRIRHHRFVTEVLPLALTAVAGAGLLAAALLAPAGRPAWTAAALAAGAAAVAGAALVREGRLDPHVRRWLGHLELAANGALLPLALWSLGIFAAINAWAHGL